MLTRTIAKYATALTIVASLFVQTATAAETAMTVRARDAWAHQQSKEALAAANEAISLNPKDAEAYAIRGKVYFNYEQFDRALSDFNTALRIQPGMQDPSVYQFRAECFISKQDYPKAVSDLQRVIRVWPNPPSYRHLGQVYRQLNKLDEAVDCFSKSIALDKKSFWTYKERGDVYVLLKKYPNALSDYSKVIEIDPSSSMGYRARAQMYLKLGKKDLADIDLKKAQEIEKAFD